VSDRDGIKAFLAGNRFPGEPETWSEEQAQALLDFQEQWFSPAWDEYVDANPHADQEKAKQGFDMVLGVFEELLRRWSAVQPIYVRVLIEGFREEKVDDIAEAFSFWDEHGRGDWLDDLLVFGTEFRSAERENGEVIARTIADDIFRANGAQCSVTVDVHQGFVLDPATYDFGPQEHDMST